MQRQNDGLLPSTESPSPPPPPTIVVNARGEREQQDLVQNQSDEAQQPLESTAQHFADAHIGNAGERNVESVKESILEVPGQIDGDDPQRPSPLASPENSHFPLLEGEEGESAVPTSFKRFDNFPRPTLPSSAPPAIKQDQGALQRMHKFALYETTSRYFVIGHDILDRRYRVLKIDRTAALGTLNLVEDEMVYSRNEMNQLLNTIDDGNKATGGMRYKGTYWGLLGFIRFTDTYYMLAISKKAQIATIGGHYIYQIEDTETIALTTATISRFQTNRNADESRFLNILGTLDLNRSFYFSYSYNVTRTLQENVIMRREKLSRQVPVSAKPDFNDMFVWNQHLLAPAIEHLESPFDWCVPIIHGFVDQSTVDVFGRSIYLTIIARRSRFFAGARFLKRGANDKGYVANDVETEQIVADMLVTSFNTPQLPHLKNPNYTAYVQHRGSIPLYWTQDNSGVSPKPAIDLNLIDPFYATVALHFDNLFQRYSAPVYVLNLVKARERMPRESKLLVEYQNAINYLNQALPEEHRIRYRAYDMSRAAKTQGQDVIGTLESIAEDIVRTTGFFQNISQPQANVSYVQNGVVRSNCIDCLDRTNAAQFVVGKRALACQLRALGVITEASLNYDSDASNLFAHMFNDQGDTLASQYGGSHLVNTTDSYRKINNWQSHSRDMLESFKRYYHNSFRDNQRQEAYNLFLGNYVHNPGQPMLWDLPNDYYLHHANPAAREDRRDYIRWYTPDHLRPRTLPPVPYIEASTRDALVSDWWDEYYKPNVLSSFRRLFAYHINSTMKYLPKPASRSARFDMSPFSVRKSTNDGDMMSQGHSKRSTPNKSKDVTIADSNSREVLNPLVASSPPQDAAKRISSLQKWLSPETDDEDDKSAPERQAGLLSPKMGKPTKQRPSQPPQILDAPAVPFKPADKALMNQWTLAQFQANSLHPSITATETNEYAKYLSQASQLGQPSSRYEDVISYAGDESFSQASLRTERDDLGADSLDGNAKAFEDYIARAVQREHFASDVRSPRQTSASDRSSALAAEFQTYLTTPSASSEPLAVHNADLERKRYRAYEKWVRGKSLFKQNKGESEGARESGGAANAAP